MKLSMEGMRALADRMRLSLTDCELEAYARDLEELETLSMALLPYTEACEEMREECPLSQMRQDEEVPSITRETVLQNASLHNGVFICVPRVVGEGES
jgi:Asp-tRNA(Asn)/Glu-tRNA(Gln) amidotransferase C subunit